MTAIGENSYRLCPVVRHPFDPTSASLETQYRNPAPGELRSMRHVARATDGKPARRAHLAVLIVLQGAMGAELGLLILRGQWMHVFLVLSVMIGTLTPELLRRQIEIPSEVQIIAILFVFASLFLGEVRDYYERIWWWDLALHGTAGLLLGLLGFQIVYVLNESSRLQVRMAPSFVSLFAFAFALAIGTLWELFEFCMDQAFGLMMQKPTPSDPSGLSDTMWDMVVNALGATIVSLGGWRYIQRRRRRHVDTWVARFIRRNRSWKRGRTRGDRRDRSSRPSDG